MTTPTNISIISIISIILVMSSSKCGPLQLLFVVVLGIPALMFWLADQNRYYNFPCQFEIIDIKNESCPHQNSDQSYSICSLKNSIKTDCNTMYNTSMVNCTSLKYQFTNEEYATCDYHQNTEYYYSYNDVLSRIDKLQSYETCYQIKNDMCSDYFVTSYNGGFVVLLVTGILTLIMILGALVVVSADFLEQCCCNRYTVEKDIESVTADAFNDSLSDSFSDSDLKMETLN